MKSIFLMIKQKLILTNNHMPIPAITCIIGVPNLISSRKNYGTNKYITITV